MEYTFNRDYVCLYFLSNVVDTKTLKIPMNAYKNVQKPGHTMLFRVVKFVLDGAQSEDVSVFSGSLKDENCYSDLESWIYLASLFSSDNPFVKITTIPFELILHFTKPVGEGFFVYEIVYVPERIQYEESYAKLLK